MMDAYSKWPEVFQMESTDTRKTIEVLRKSFAAYGLPEQIVTDNGPQFISKEFCDFVRYYGIRHIKSAPYHPATNGAVERFIQTFKHAMKSNTDRTLSYRLASFLLAYRTTPHATTNEVPSVLFLNRTLKTRLTLLKPDIQARVLARQASKKLDMINHVCVNTLLESRFG